MPAFEWVHVQLHQQKGMISLSPPTICNSAVYLGTTNQKKVYQQLLANSKVEVSGMAKGKWIRLTGEAVIDDTVEAREAMLEANPPLRDWYSADDGKFTVFYLKNMQAVLYSFTGDPEILDN
ncbi:NimC/NimA family protein [Proteus mirabilis]|uniref:NimC/NimA family protein n=1 Tax=Proteus mirabilis TaxID=584 RepID=UPI003BF4F97F